MGLWIVIEGYHILKELIRGSEYLIIIDQTKDFAMEFEKIVFVVSFA